MRLGQLLQSHPRESELIEAVLSRLPEELRGRVHIWAEASGRVHILPRGLSRGRWWRVHGILTELGGYWWSEPWPELPHWVIPAGKALSLLRGG
ncbi:MAG: hypothetical protein QXH67_00035 [Candidatus Bathyarchaeia archaeon]